MTNAEQHLDSYGALEIVRDAATCHGVTVADLLSTSRVVPLPRARAAAYWALHERSGWSYGRIAAVFGVPLPGVRSAVKRYAAKVAT